MTRTPVERADPRPSAQKEVAESRVRFLTAETPEPRSVRGPILASWRRSHDLRVAADKIEMAYEPGVELDTRLTRSAEPVLRGLREQLDGQSVSVILTDPTGLVLRRLTGDGDLERHLDQVLLAPGFSYAEKYVGTNGIGTALEVGGPAHVFGHEHYAEHLEDLACAGVPIHHPMSGRLVGAVDLTCWRKDAGALLLTLAKTTAEQIRQALLTDAGSSQMGLFQEYLRTCSRRSGIVFALNSDVVMLNDYARTALDPADQAILLAQATEAMLTGARGTFRVALHSGQTARLNCRPVRDGDQTAGLLAHATIDQSDGKRSRARDATPQMPLPGLVGKGLPWLHACHEVEQAFRSAEWLAVQGEPGVGKLAVLRAVQLRRQPVGRFVVLEARDAGSVPDWLGSARRAIEDADNVVIRHVDRLDGPGLRGISSALQDARVSEREHPLWAAVTLGPSTDTGNQELVNLLQQFPGTVVVPPLRLHLDDMSLLVPLFLSRLGQSGHPTCSPEAMRMLMRMSWPGNAGQVYQLLREVLRHRRTGHIGPEDLPPEAHTVTRRVLSPLESVERDAVVRALSDAHWNKIRAARSLGMSRATIYRKIHDYGIVPPPS